MPGTAAPEVQLATRTTRAWLLHPGGTAEGIEGRGVCPDIAERMLAHVPEFEARNRLGGVTGQNLACWRHVERTAAPTAHARLWIAGVVVGHHGVDDDTAVMTRAQLLHRRGRPLDLLARWHQRGPVLERPAIILHMRNLDAARAKGEREIDH